MRRKIVVALTLCALAAPVLAEDTADDAFAKIDENRDNSLSIEEAGSVEGLAEQWDALDIDGDGQLMREEFARADIAAPAVMPQ